MDVLEAIKKRQSVRVMKSDPVPEKVLFELIAAAQEAPSAGNQQLWKFIIIRDDKLKKDLFEKAKASPLILKAPAVIVALYQRNIIATHFVDVQTIAGAIENILVAAPKFGLGTTWICHTGDERKVKEILDIPKNYFVGAFITVGYPAYDVKKPKRKEVDEICSFERFSFPEDVTYSPNPKKWTIENLLQYRSRIISYTSPMKNDYVLGAEEDFYREIEIFSGLTGDSGRIAEFLPYMGAHSCNFIEKMKGRLTLLEYSRSTVEFILKRAELRGTKDRFNCSIAKEKELEFDKIKDGYFDCIVCFQKIEDLPNYEKMISETRRMLRPGGKFIFSMKSSLSLFGIYYFIKYHVLKNKLKGGQLFSTHSPFEIKAYLKKEGFSIKWQNGITLLPVKKLRGMTIPGFLANFCRVIVVECEKK